MAVASVAALEYLHAVGRWLPPEVVVRVFSSMLMGVDFTATDVPGPPADAYFAGAKVESFLAFPPTAGAELNAGLVTMAGRLSIGVAIDRAAVPDPERMTACLRQGFDEVIGAAVRCGHPRSEASRITIGASGQPEPGECPVTNGCAWWDFSPFPSEPEWCDHGKPGETSATSA